MSLTSTVLIGSYYRTSYFYGKLKIKAATILAVVHWSAR
jgi:hypothetical protein